ncbi:MAG: DUF1573 domain-containing protein [Flavobacterium sp.]
MNSVFKIILLAGLLFSAVVIAQPRIEFEGYEYNIGTVKREEAAKIDIPFTNTGNTPLIITGVKGTGTPATDYPREPVAPGSTGYIRFRMPTNFIGGTRQHIYVTTNVNNEVIVLTVKLWVVENDNPVREVRGKVLDKDEAPVPGVTIAVEYTDRRTTTGFEGDFSIPARQTDTLTIAPLGYIPQKISAENVELVVRLQEKEEEMIQAIPPPFAPGHDRRRSLPDVTIVTQEDLQNAGKPWYDFRKNAERNVYIVFVPGSEMPQFSSSDTEYQKKYNVRYSMSGSMSPEYTAQYNRLTFKHLDKMHGKSWRDGVRKDAVGLKN